MLCVVGDKVGAEETVVSAHKDVDTGQLWGCDSRQGQGARHDARQKSFWRWCYSTVYTPSYRLQTQEAVVLTKFICWLDGVKGP